MPGPNTTTCAHSQKDPCVEYYVGSLRVNPDAGRLTGTYYDQYLKSHQLASGLTVETGRWSKVDIIHDLSSIRLVADGRTGPGVPILRTLFVLIRG